MAKKFKKGYFNVDHALDSMDMEFTNYTPSLEALEFFAIIKVFYGEDFEIPNSKFHYFIVDMLFGNVDEKDFPYSDEINANIPINPSRIGVIAARGSAKSTITTTFYPIYCAIKGETPLIKNISHMLILSDSQQGGARDQAKLLAGEFEKSVFAKEYFEKMRFTESEAELVRSGSGPIEKRHILIKFKGAMTGGIRSGSRNPITRDRYAIIIGDDVIKNEADAYSETIMKNVKTALFSDALNAMRGKNTQLVLINTPFRKADPIYTALESGVFTPLAAPICKKIYEDMPKEEFKGLWTAMHDYDAVMERYLNAIGNHTAREFSQELMLRVSSEEDKLVQDDQIQWYDRSVIKKNLDYYNLYATTDYTASNDLKGDFSCTMLWAVSNNNDWFMLDLSIKKQTITDQYKPLFKMINQWGSKNSRHVYVGVEIDGQQQLNLHTLKKMMLEHNTFFSFARQIGASITQEGIRRKGKGNKHEHFMRVHPLFQEHKVYLPEDLKNTPDMKELLEELNYVTYSGIAAKHDDAIDCISMISSLDVLLPSAESNKEFLEDHSNSSIWEMDFEDNEFSNNKSTIF
ncbi:MAG: hypothetical protein PVF17_00235 [Ignavibacteria bacterium]|jgi:phage terminase large subunit-like protein